jgi:hypothetical protein
MRRPRTFTKRGTRQFVARGCRSPSPRRLQTLAEVMADYRANGARSAQDELRFYAGLPTLRQAVRAAGRAWMDAEKQRHPHQYRLPPSVLDECALVLELELPAIRRARSFEELHETVKVAIGRLRGVGPLMVYDTALRIGAKLRLRPRRVFLHAGVREGARNLGLDVRAESLTMAELPKEFRRLRPLEAEDVLCIYKDEFRRIRLADI